MRSQRYQYWFPTHDNHQNAVNRPDLQRIVIENSEDTGNKVDIMSIEVGQTRSSPFVVLIKEEVAQMLLGKYLGGIRITSYHKHYNMGVGFEPHGLGWKAVPLTRQNRRPLFGWRIYLFQQADAPDIKKDIDLLVEHVEKYVPPKVRVNWHLYDGTNPNRFKRSKICAHDVDPFSVKEDMAVANVVPIINGLS